MSMFDEVTLSDGHTFKNPYVGRSHADKNGYMHPVYEFEYRPWFYYRNGSQMNFLNKSEL